MMNTPKPGEKAALSNGQYRLAQDFNRIFLETIENIVHPPEGEHPLFYYYGVADQWWCTMVEDCADYPALCFRAEVAILELAKYMWQHVEPDWKGTSDRLRFCLFIKLFVDFVRPHVWGQAVFSMWNPERLGDSGKTLLERNRASLSRRKLERHGQSFRSLLVDLEDTVNWTYDSGADLAKPVEMGNGMVDWGDDDEEKST